MASRSGPVHVVTTRRSYKGKVYQSHLLRRSYREAGKVKNLTLANLSHLPDHVVELIRRSLRGEAFLSVEEQFDVSASLHHGHVEAVLLAMRRLGFAQLIQARPGRERDRVVAMTAARVLRPQSKLATTRWWHTTTLPSLLGVEQATEDDLYGALDWLLEQQPAIERRLARRHLEQGAFVLYDLSSSYFEGSKCPLAALGHNRDGKKGKLQVNYGVVADRRGCPVSVSVFSGDTADPKTLLPKVREIRESFGVTRLVIVGDRGMVAQRHIDVLRQEEGVGWITALKSGAIRQLVRAGELQLGLFDERGIFELAHPDYPDERLVACRNPDLALLRAHKRQALLDATCKELGKIRGMVGRGRLAGKDKIGVRVGRVVNKYKMAKHLELEIADRSLAYRLKEDQIAAEAALDGVYVIRTSEPKERVSQADVVRTYKDLAGVERAFRSLKTIDLNVRPIRHWSENRVRGHIFLCLLAYYVQWHMQEAWRSLLFSDEDLEAKRHRDPVAAASRSQKALRKVREKELPDGSAVHSFRTLLEELSTIVRNVCHRKGASQEPTFELYTTPQDKQRQALDLLETISV